MSKSPPNSEGNIAAYLAGFALSLIFTILPYRMVTSQSMTGTRLLMMILGFAVIQMIIQVTFFLHIGRGPKPNWNLFFFASTVGIILLVVGGSILIINNLHYNMLPDDQTAKLLGDEGISQIDGKQTGVCQQSYINHKITIANGLASTIHVTAARCDTITFISGDKHSHTITFGAPPTDEAYAGEKDLKVSKGYNQTISLSRAGTYKFYDYYQPEITGSFTVSP